MSGFERGFGSATRLTSFVEVDEVFRSRDFTQGSHIDGHPSASLFNGTVLTLNGDAHFERRRLESKLFRKSALRRLENDVPTALDRQLSAAALTTGVDGRARGDLLKIIRASLLPMAAAVVGLDGVESDESIEELRLLLVRLSEGSSARWSTLPLDDVVRAAVSAKESFVEHYFKPAWRRRERIVAAVSAGDIEATRLPDDLITLLITSPISDDYDVSVRESLVFLTGGANTPALVTPFVVRDVLDWFGAHPDDRPPSGPELEGFLWRALLESLRLHLEVPAHFRIALRDVLLSTGRKIDKGDAVALDIVRASRDPSVYGADADRFNPLRAAPPKGMAFGFAFGGGAHTCIGRELMVGPATGDVVHEHASHGILGKLLVGLFEHGIELDPERPPLMNPDKTRQEYVEFPVTFCQS